MSDFSRYDHITAPLVFDMEEHFRRLPLPLLPSGYKGRMDANETAMFAREMEAFYNKTYNTLFPAAKFREVLPVKSDLDPWKTSSTYYQMTDVGQAEVVHTLGEDMPGVTQFGKMFNRNTETVGAYYEFDFIEMMNAVGGREPLASAKARIARDMIERALDTVAAVGNAKTNMAGLINVSGIQTGTPVSLSSSSSVDDILAPIKEAWKLIWEGTQTIFQLDTLVVSPKMYTLLSTKPLSQANAYFHADTILAHLQKGELIPGIKNVIPWVRLTDSVSAGVDYMVGMNSNPDVVHFSLPLDFYQLPPEMERGIYRTTCIARTHGVVSPYPKALCRTALTIT